MKISLFQNIHYWLYYYWLKYNIKMKSQYSVIYMISLIVVVLKAINIVSIIYLYYILHDKYILDIKGIDVFFCMISVVSIILVLDSINVLFNEKAFSLILDRVKGLSLKKRAFCKIIFYIYMILSIVATISLILM